MDKPAELPIETPIRVRYAETDQMRQAYNSHYLVWFEAARGHLMRHLGIPYGDIEATGFYLPVSRFWARLSRPARYDDALGVRIWVAGLQSRAVEFYYRIMRGEEMLAEGGTTHVNVDAAGRPTRLPASPCQALAAYAASHPLPATSRR
jgi:acyl-CoA thioester hydrolase